MSLVSGRANGCVFCHEVLIKAHHAEFGIRCLLGIQPLLDLGG
jgi:hypothetical protein